MKKQSQLIGRSVYASGHSLGDKLVRLCFVTYAPDSMGLLEMGSQYSREELIRHSQTLRLCRISIWDGTCFVTSGRL